MMPDIEKSPEQLLLGRGVYTLANNKVIEWFEAFIRSFRKTNPTMPLTVIPYDQDISSVLALQEQFHFEMMESGECAHYDALADKVKVIKKEAGCFRKFACFFGKYRDFLFLDADIVTSIPLGPLFDTFSPNPAQFVYFDARMDMCYKEHLAMLMAPAYHSPAYNSGAFFSRRGMLDESEIFVIAEKATAICEGFAIGGEQPFFNYVTDISRLKYERLDSIAPGFAPLIWVGEPFTYDSNVNLGRDMGEKIMPFVHWAGFAYPTMTKPKIFLQHRTDGLFWMARIRYTIYFYFCRYRIYFGKERLRWKKVIVQFFTNKSWRKFYLYKLIGIKTKLPV